MDLSPLPAPRDDLLPAFAQRMAGLLLLQAPTLDSVVELVRPLVGEATARPDALAAALAAVAERQYAAVRAPEAQGLLARLVRSRGLSAFELDVLVLALLPELDDRLADVLAGLAGGGLLARRPTVATAIRVLLGPGGDRTAARRHLSEGPLWRSGLLAPAAPGVPFFDRVLQPVAPVRAAIDGAVPDRLDAADAVVRRWGRGTTPAPSAELSLRPELVQRGRELAAWLALQPHGLIHLLDGADERGALIVSALARSLDRAVVEVELPPGAPPDALREAGLCAELSDALLVLLASESGARVQLPADWASSGPVVVRAAPSVAVGTPAELPSRSVRLPHPRPIEQALIWQQTLEELGGEAQVDVLANQTRLSVAQIRRTVEQARVRATLDGRAAPGHADVARALDEVVGQPHSPMARVLRPRVGWSRLVLPRRAKGQLEELVRRVQHRVTVQDRWGMRGSSGRGEGLVGMLHGESGTGKTFAAEAVATQLALPMMSVDLSRVVSKYIGETEKNLSELFDAAEGFRALLFFDEADALFGKRTAVQDAHDRYANIETNYLLQRLEVYEGVALLATNLLQNLDDAFTRRLQFIIHFPRPNPGQQRLIWQRHLPGDQLGPDVDLDELARTFDLVGGEIHNAALAAAYAAAAHQVPISQAFLADAARAELVKRGRPVPDP